MIDEMVDMQQENEQTLISKPSHPQGGYISEDEEEVVITEMRKAADMVGDKFLSLQADSNVETGASDPWCTQDEADYTSANLEPISMQAGDLHGRVTQTAIRDSASDPGKSNDRFAHGHGERTDSDAITDDGIFYRLNAPSVIDLVSSSNDEGRPYAGYRYDAADWKSM